jgi:YHS domain-containing protein
LRALILAFAAALFALSGPVSADEPVFHGREGIAIGGYDTVSFFIGDQPVEGSAEYAVMWKGVVWRFASARNQEVFESNPRAYAPRFGGYCAYAVSQGYLASGSPSDWQIVDGRLYILHNGEVHRMWQPQAASYIVQAAGNWPAVLRD